MENLDANDSTLEQQIARRLKELRVERGWSLDALSNRCEVSRATLSRIENADVSPTAHVLGKLCAAFGLTLSRLMQMVEENFEPLIHRDAQPVWHDPKSGFHRRSISPPAKNLTGEALECTLEPGTHIAYDDTPRPGLEHHLLLLDGRLKINVDGQSYDLRPGDCLRYQLYGPSAFTTPDDSTARYILFIV